MTLIGLTLWQTLGLGAAAASVLVALYLLKLRRPRRTVAYLSLWVGTTGGALGSPRYGRPRDLLSLLLQLSILGLLLAALVDPKPGRRAEGPLSTVVLIDSSIAMQSQHGDSTRFEAALKRASQVVEAMRPGDRSWIVAAGEGLQPAQANPENRAALLAALTRLSPTDGTLRMGQALQYAADVLAGMPRRRIVLLTGADAPAPEAGVALQGIELYLERIGVQQDNVSVAAIGVRTRPLEPSRRELLIDVSYAGGGRAAGDLVVSSEQGAVFGAPLELSGPTHERIVLRQLPAIGGRLTAQWRRTDGQQEALTADDSITLQLPPQSRRRVLVVSDSNRYLEAALALDSGLEVTSVLPGGSLPSGSFEVALSDGDPPDPRRAAAGS
jgi:Ca-activated chloride channel family protein